MVSSSRRNRSPIRHYPSGGKRCTPRSSPSQVKVAIARSVLSCRRRLAKIFSSLAVFGRTSPSSHKRGFRRLSSTPTKPLRLPSTPTATEAASLPPPSFPEKKTVFLDLDETLVHSRTDPPPDRYDFTIHPSIDGRVVPFYVLKRPGADELLRAAAAVFEVVVFTAGLREYASLVLDRLDPAGELIAHRLYRDSCREMDGKLVKDLAGVGRALNRAVLVDDNPNAYVLQPENALRVTPFSNDLGDRELSKVMKFFEVAVLFEDMRDAVAYYRSEFGGHKPRATSVIDSEPSSTIANCRKLDRLHRTNDLQDLPERTVHP